MKCYIRFFSQKIFEEFVLVHYFVKILLVSLELEDVEEIWHFYSFDLLQVAHLIVEGVVANQGNNTNQYPLHLKQFNHKEFNQFSSSDKLREGFIRFRREKSLSLRNETDWIELLNETREKNKRRER